MASGRKSNVKKQYSPESLMLRTIVGIVLIALGALTLISLIDLVPSGAFIAIKRVALGLGGGLAYGLPVFLVWGGGLIVLSARSKAPVRALLLLLICYVCILTIINLMVTTASGSLMEYIAQENKLASPMSNDYEGFSAFVSRAYLLCSMTGQGGGAIGMLLAWPVWYYRLTVAGVVVLCIITLVCLLCVSRIDVKGIYQTLKKRSEEKAAIREREQAQRDAQTQAQKQNEKERPHSLFGKKPAFARQQEQPQYTQEQLQAMQYAEYQRQLMEQQKLAQQYAQPVYANGTPVPAQRRPYDESIVKVMDITDDPSEPVASPYGAKASAQRARKKKSPTEEAVQPTAQFPPPILPSERKPIEPERMVEQENAYKRPTVSLETAQTPSQKAQAAAQKASERLMNMQSGARKPVVSGEGTLMSGQRLDEPELKLPPKKKQAEQSDEPAAIPYQYPTLDLLQGRSQELPDTSAQDAYNGHCLEQTLRSFGIESQVQHVAHGPAITRYELSLLTTGINVSKIAKLADNIALDLAAKGGVRVEVPIPGTNLFGVEIPNDHVIPVPLYDVLVSPEMKQNRSPLAVALGKDIAGEPIICDLSKMPHLLIAGQTGSGKSVCINTIINSILYRSSPKQVRMIMIDPKVVELQCYNVIPHLLIPVVSDPHKAAGALAWAVAEMLDRYHRIKSKNVRNIEGYNQRLLPGEESMPHIVIIIDELSDLMLACRKEVEDSIIRIAQLARAAGIHLIVATQRPTVNVITGLIKANIPSRIAFAVSSQIDSRTILDQNGADKLLGKGDMLYMPSGLAAIRVQGCFLSDGEIENIMSFIERTSSTDFDENILEVMESDDEAPASEHPGDEDRADERLPEAIEMVITDGQASISMLQRRMKIGYARAGALIDEMARRGIVSKSAGSKPREVLVTREQYEEMRNS